MRAHRDARCARVVVIVPERRARGVGKACGVADERDIAFNEHDEYEYEYDDEYDEKSRTARARALWTFRENTRSGKTHPPTLRAPRPLAVRPSRVLLYTFGVRRN